MHFSAVMGIGIKYRKVRDSRNYTSPLAGLIWMSRLLILEYALSKREYVTLGWPTCTAYQDQALRFENIRQIHLVDGCYCSISDLMGYGIFLNKKHYYVG